MKFATKTLFAVLLATSTAVMADDSTSLTFDLKADIPTERYYVQFENPAFGTTEQVMNWDARSQTLEQLRTNLVAMNNVDSVKAYLDGAAVLVHTTDPTQEIPLTVSIAGQSLPATQAAAVTIVDDVTKTEQILPLVVSQTTPATIPDAGEYKGTVKMMFDFDLTV
ncbi:CS1 type fimbrial major subunit [Pantoea dispersa]|uniref:CS1 type fimbrial major subunit n=1 Tax=Pantoea dispersa TaxID=59814 RepID=UPI002DB72F3C|nr:CS1 type fimbrial major subunit [Pantoea dispersa]MEB5972561.1 fimbrial protein [Pantoea dispersa]